MKTRFTANVLRLLVIFIFVMGLFSVPRITAQAEGLGAISGTIQNEIGEPLEGIPVNAQDYESGIIVNAVTDSTGFYTISDLPMGDYCVYNMSAGYYSGTYNRAYSCGSSYRVTVVSGQTTENIDFNLETWGVISGTIRDIYGNPIENADVAAEGIYPNTGGDSEKTLADGSYRIIVKAGDYNVYTEAPTFASRYYPNGYTMFEKSLITVNRAEEITGIDITLEAGGTIAGTVLDEDQNPVPDTWVCVSKYATPGYEYGRCNKVNEDGTYSITDLAPFSTIIGASTNTPGYDPINYNGVAELRLAEEILLTPGITITGIDIILPSEAPKGSISGTVRDASGNPIPNLFVCILDLHFRWCGNTDSAGTYTITGVPDGDWIVVTYDNIIWQPIYYPNTYDSPLAEPVHVSAGQNTPSIDFTFGLEVPNASFGVRANVEQVHAWNFALDSTLTLTIDDPSTPIDPDYSTSQIVNEVPEDPNSTYVYFDLNGIYNIYAGNVVTLSDGFVTKTLTVTNLIIIGFDNGNGKVSGRAQPGARIEVFACDQGCTPRYVYVKENGWWLADFAHPGSESDEQDTLIFTPGMWIDAQQVNSNNDRTIFGLSAPSPSFQVTISGGDLISGYNWPLGEMVTLRIHQPGTPAENDYISTHEVFLPEWSPDQTRTQLDFELYGVFDILPGMEITMTDVVTTKTTTVSNLLTTTVNVESDIASGVATPGANLDICSVVGNTSSGFRSTTADENGNWFMDFSKPIVSNEQDEHPATIDLTYGFSIVMREWDNDGDIQLNGQDIMDKYTLDHDLDGIPNYYDNAPEKFNPDQLESDGDELADVIDPCPADASNTCNTQGSASSAIGMEGGTLTTQDGTVTMQVPPAALTDPISLSITDTGGGYQVTTDLGLVDSAVTAVIGPTGTQFSTPVTLTFYWPEGTPDESDLILFKDGAIIAGPCGQDFEHCNMDTNTFIVSVDSLSSFVIGMIANQPPEILSVNTPVEPQPAGTNITVSTTFFDPDLNNTHNAVWGWGDGSSTTVMGYESDEVAGHVYTTPGVYTITVSITDAAGETDEGTSEYIVIYDTAAGFVTGGGWINSPAGAYTAAPSLTGKATFGFVSKYQKGANVPTGNTEFQFKMAGLNFSSTSYDWLVVAGAKAQYKGIGTINGVGSYHFMLTAIDGQVNGGGGLDKFRIKIWDASGHVTYDNQQGASDDALPATAIQGGSIVIHK